MVIVLWRYQYVEMESAKVCYIKVGEKDNVLVGCIFVCEANLQIEMLFVCPSVCSLHMLKC